MNGKNVEILDDNKETTPAIPLKRVPIFEKISIKGEEEETDNLINSIDKKIEHMSSLFGERAIFKNKINKKIKIKIIN